MQTCLPQPFRACLKLLFMNDKATQWRDINNRMQARRSLRTVIATALSAAGARLFFDRHPYLATAWLVFDLIINPGYFGTYKIKQAFNMSDL